MHTETQYRDITGEREKRKEDKKKCRAGRVIRERYRERRATQRAENTQEENQ